jgi:acetyl-CoA carboxylase alpha subunit
MTSQRPVASKSSAFSWPKFLAIRQACDQFIELRQGPAESHRPMLVTAAAVIGHHSVFVLIHDWNGKTGRRGTIKEERRRSLQSRKSQHVLRLAQRFGRPVVVCVVDAPGSSKAGPATSKRLSASPLHLMSQWRLGVPVILFVSAAKVSFGIFGMWLADRCVSLEHSRFVLESPDRTEIESEVLVRCHLLDGTMTASAGGTTSAAKTVSVKLRHMLTSLLDDVVRSSQADRWAKRKERVARLENYLMRPR